MKKLEIIIRPERLDDLKAILNECDAHGLMITNIMGYGIQRGHKREYNGIDFGGNLLPKVKVEEEENEEDIEIKLMERLIEYKRFKAVSEFYNDKYVSSGEVFSKKPEVIEEIKPEKVDNDDIFKNITLLDLYNIYNKILENYREKQNKVNVVQKKIYVDKYKVEDKMEELLKKFNSVEVIEFNNLMKESSCKLETVVIFLALLELIKIRTIQVFQDENFSNILIKRRRDIE